ncbi:MAG: FkbM family methyltransferase [Desulfarculaceae bacterium]|nr:FkbM family methyltransferase [Desulfarculaceae bacterium]MCF8074002.1 FkbM family methyltransferase [Desulfarculaceae bacterium]MCF8102688.1 FkbM family methyltransferase [Desulfarculaceae bacterium]MCF8116071.1 FkbM family methyltransferase [Desulfarculaceae bacterium]
MATSPDNQNAMSPSEKLTVGIAYSKPYALWLLMAGRVIGCPAKVALKAGAQQKELDRFTETIGSQSSLLESSDQHELWQTPFGRYWIPKSHLSQESLFEMLGERKSGHYGGAEHGVRQGDVALDCGANVGVFVVEALDAGASKVIACEPEPHNLDCLQLNFSDEISAGRVIIFPKGLWHEKGTLEMAPGSSPAGGSFVKASDHGIKLPVISIDDLVDELGLDRIDFIKMDIEGAERNAIRGGRNTIKKCRPRMALSAYHLPDDPEVIPREVYQAIADYKFSCTHASIDYKGLLHSHIVPAVYFFE